MHSVIVCLLLAGCLIGASLSTTTAPPITTTEPPITTTAAPATTSTGPVCVDKGDSATCEKNKKFCLDNKYHDFLNENCAKTCNFCNASNPDCRDTSNSCKTFATNGFCTSSWYTPAQKKQYCAKTCGLC
ncbi:hypothetical protein QR680_013973 [Steinernema hermaphroditum]|uniref:ShKT domain-containing protein n=1 Tax=Steinernema hermaphroditum TaxID=289476 RepID=A0AA39M3E7_9BILA|nr:hypothetical protein QR680_013973 [Steinernema hermaphroditum]